MSSPTDLVILGAGGHGRQLYDLVAAHNAAGRPPYRVLGFLDDGAVDDDRLGRMGTVHLGPISRLAELEAAFAVGIADPAARRRIVDREPVAGRAPESLIHPSVLMGSLVALGPGAFVSAQAFLDTSVSVGANVHINHAAMVGHDSRIGDFVTISPGARISGSVTVGDDAFLGTNAVVLQGITIGPGAVIAAGAVVRRDVAPGVTFTGLLDARRGR